MGDGIAIKLKSDFIVSPINGELMTVFPTGHAFGITGHDGLEVLVHIGIYTVELEGKGFNVLANTGDKVRAGQPIVTIDRQEIEKAGYDTTTMLVITNANNQEIHLQEKGEVKASHVLN